MQWGRDRPAFLPKRALSLSLSFSPLYPSKSNDIWRYFDVTPLRRPPPMGGRERRLQRTFFAARCFCLYDRQARRPSASTADRTSLYVSSWSTHFLGPLRNLQEYFLDEIPPSRPPPSDASASPIAHSTPSLGRRYIALLGPMESSLRGWAGRSPSRLPPSCTQWARGGRSRRLKAERRPRIN